MYLKFHIKQNYYYIISTIQVYQLNISWMKTFATNYTSQLIYKVNVMFDIIK